MEATELCGVLTTLNFSDLGRRAAPPPPPRATTAHLVVHMHARGRAAPPGGTPARTPLAVRRRYVRGPVGPSGGALAHGGAALCFVGCSCVWCGRAEVCGDRVRAVVYCKYTGP